MCNFTSILYMQSSCHCCSCHCHHPCCCCPAVATPLTCADPSFQFLFAFTAVTATTIPFPVCTCLHGIATAHPHLLKHICSHSSSVLWPFFLLPNCHLCLPAPCFCYLALVLAGFYVYTDVYISINICEIIPLCLILKRRKD